MKQCQIVGKIEPDELRREIIFAKKRVDMFVMCMDGEPKNWGLSRTLGDELKTWSSILNVLVKRIVPSE